MKSNFWHSHFRTHRLSMYQCPQSYKQNFEHPFSRILGTENYCCANDILDAKSSVNHTSGHITVRLYETSSKVVLRISDSLFTEPSKTRLTHTVKVSFSALKTLTPTLSIWLLRSHWTLKSILRETLFLDQLHDFSSLSLNSFLKPFLKSKIM